MNCHRCGNVLPTNATVCPHCDRAPAKTKRLVQKDTHQTTVLVSVERCENCGFLVYAGDTECSACGSAIYRPWKAAVDKAASGRAAKTRSIWLGVAISLTLLCLTALAWKFLAGPSLP